MEIWYKICDILFLLFKYNIYICLEDKEIIICLKKLQEVTEYGIKKIKNELRKNNKITINNKTYIELEKYSRII